METTVAREAQLELAAKMLAQNVYGFLHSLTHTAAQLNAALAGAEAAFGPLPVQLPPIPMPSTAGTAEQHLQQLKTPLKEPAKSISFPAIESPLWSPVAMFQQCLPAGTLPAAAPMRSTGRARQRQRRPSGQLSPARHPPPPPLFDAPPPAAQQQLFFGSLAQLAGQGALAKSGSNMQALAGEHGLVHWKSEVSANMAALQGGGATHAAGPAAAAGAAAASGAPPAAAGAGPPRESSPISSPRGAALMAVCLGEAEQPQPQPQPLARLTSNLSSHYSACAGAPPGEHQQHRGAAPSAAAATGLAKERSDLAELAMLAEEESHAAAAAAAAAAVQEGCQPGAAAAAGGGKRSSECCAAEVADAPAGQPAVKRQRVGSNSPPHRHRGAAAGTAAAVAAAAAAGGANGQEQSQQRSPLEDAGSLPIHLLGQ